MFEQFPMLGPQGAVIGTREFAIPRLPYTIVYQISGEATVDILTVIHQLKRYPPET